LSLAPSVKEAAVQTWSLNEIETPEGSRSPVVLETADDARTVLIGLDPGQSLGDHQVKERAWIVLLSGSAHIESGGDSVEAVPGTLATFAPDEVHSISTENGARLLLFLAPWPGDGHYRGEERSL
jgi:quercetin dioxygenase-like cupin family protein